jgi:hypothetical protein
MDASYVFITIKLFAMQHQQKTSYTKQKDELEMMTMTRQSQQQSIGHDIEYDEPMQRLNPSGIDTERKGHFHLMIPAITLMMNL